MRVKLDHVVIAVGDRARADAFYRDVLGAEIFERDGGVYYRFGSEQLNVHTAATDAGELVARAAVTPGNSDLCFVWDGPIEEALEHLRRHGVPVEAGPLRRYGARGGGQSVYFRDPDGSLLEFIGYDSAGEAGT